jgi:hypothetical protein
MKSIVLAKRSVLLAPLLIVLSFPLFLCTMVFFATAGAAKGGEYDFDVVVSMVVVAIDQADAPKMRTVLSPATEARK